MKLFKGSLVTLVAIASFSCWASKEAGISPLHDAIYKCDLDLAKSVATDANIKSVDSQGWTPLHWTAYMGIKCVPITEFLMDYMGSKLNKKLITEKTYMSFINAKDNDGMTPLLIALLTVNSSPEQPLCMMARLNAMLSKKIISPESFMSVLTSRDVLKKTALHYACTFNEVTAKAIVAQVVQMKKNKLIDKKTLVTFLNMKDENKTTALKYAEVSKNNGAVDSIKEALKD